MYVIVITKYATRLDHLLGLKSVVRNTTAPDILTVVSAK